MAEIAVPIIAPTPPTCSLPLHPRAVWRQRLRRLRLDAFLVGRQPFLCVDVVDDAGRRPDDSADGDSALLVGLLKCTNYSDL